jgi:hypothetical protein
MNGKITPQKNISHGKISTLALEVARMAENKILEPEVFRVLAETNPAHPETFPPVPPSLVTPI